MLRPCLIVNRKYKASNMSQCSFYNNCELYQSGYAFISKKIFDHYFSNSIIKYIKEQRIIKGNDNLEAIIIFDGHKSHLSQILNSICEIKKFFFICYHIIHLTSFNHWIR